MKTKKTFTWEKTSKAKKPGTAGNGSEYVLRNKAGKKVSATQTREVKTSGWSQKAQK